MANEFIARKGIISLDSIQVSGSITATGGITVSGSISSASFATSATTASSADNFFVRQNLTASSALFTGSITAQTLVVQTVTSSIVYSSGSNIFGNQLTDTQRFTGSMFITGSTLNVNGGAICATGNTCFGGNTIIAGCLGIGTNTPTRKLTIDGSGGFSAATGSAIRLNNTTSGRFALIDFDDSQNFNIWSSTDSGNIRFFLNSGAGTERMRIDYCGNVGIGYTPCVNYGPLQVKSPASTYTIDLVGRTSGLNGESQITFWNSGQTVVQGAIGNIARCMVFYAGGTEVMRMTCGGLVAIGNTNPQANGASAVIDVGNGSGGTINLRDTNTGIASEGFHQIYGGDNRMYFYAGGSGASAYMQFYTNDSERMRITSGGCVSIGTACSISTLTIKSANDGGIVLTRPSNDTTSHLRISTTETGGDAYTVRYNTFNNEMIFSTYSGGGTGGNIIFRTTCIGAGSETERMRITCYGPIGMGTTSLSSEANLFLGAQSTVEGGQLVLQKGTSCNCATHLDNYANQFRVLSGTDTGTTTVNMSVNHTTGNTTINGAVYRYNGQTVVGGSFTNLTAIDASSSRTYLIQMIPTNVEATVSYRIFGVIQVNATSGTYAFTTLSSQTMDVTFSGSTVQARVTNGQQWTFNWSITQLL